MCFISSFTSERVDLPGDEREESVAMAEGYNYIRTLPSKQWVIMLPRTLRGPAAAARHPAGFHRISQDFTCFPEQGLLLPDLFSPTDPSSCQQLPLMCCQPSTLLLWWWNDIPQETQAAGGNAQWPVQSASWWSLWKIPAFQRTAPGSVPLSSSQRAEGDAKSRAEQELPGPRAHKANMSL